MNDYISRKEALKVFSVYKGVRIPEKDVDGFANTISYRDAKSLIRSIPAADVRPVVHGKWEPGNPICPVCGEDKFKGLDADIWADWQPLFCPNCGCYMGGKANG